MTNGTRVERDLEIARKLRGTDEDAEFGSGFLQQLFYFSAHLNDERGHFVHQLWRHIKHPNEVNEVSPRAISYIKAFGEHNAVQHAVMLVMSGATDHLHSLIIPDNIPEEIRCLVQELQETAYPLRLCRANMSAEKAYKDFCTVESLLRTTIRLLDATMFNIMCDPGQYK